MGRKIAIRAAVLMPVMVFTWIATSTIMGQVKPAAQKSRTAAKTTSKSGGISNENLRPAASLTTGVAGRPANAVDLPAPLRSILAFKDYKVEVQGQQVIVVASADMTTVLRDRIYMWKLSVYSDGAKKPSLEIPYTEQAFEIDPSGRMTPTFAESFTLPPGKHKVRVTLHKFQAGIDPEALKVATDDHAIGREKIIEIR